MRKIGYIIVLALLAGCVDMGGKITELPVGLGAEEPSVITTDNGLVISWQEPYEGDILLKMSAHNGIKWSPAKTIAKGEEWFVNWADYPAIVANGDLLFAHYLQKTSNEMLAYNVMFLVSSDMGESWSEPKQLHQDTVTAEHGFVSAVPYADGFYVTWLDGRYTTGNKGKFTLRGVNVTNEGALVDAVEIDDDVCTCCQTSMTIIDNVPWSFYRDRSEEEIRDIYFSKFVDNSWSEPELFNEDNWHIPGCPVNGPMATSYGNNLAVAWFSGADGAYNVKLKISTDAGNSFQEEILVDGPKSIGRVDIKMDASQIYVTFITNNGEQAAIKLNTYDYSGKLIDAEILASVSAARGTGFPRTALWHENLIVTWTDVEEHTIKVLEYPLNKEHISAQAGIR